MRCETVEGCPIGDTAPSQENERIIMGFLEAKKMQCATNLPETSRPMLDDVGLIEDVKLLSALESVWIEYLKYKRESR